MGAAARLNATSTVRGMNPAQAVRGTTGNGVSARGGANVGLSTAGSRASATGQARANARTGLFTQGTAGTTETETGAGEEAGVNLRANASRGNVMFTGRDRAVHQAELNLNHRLAQIDRMRDRALASGDAKLLAQADHLEATARTQYEHRAEVLGRDRPGEAGEVPTSPSAPASPMEPTLPTDPAPTAPETGAEVTQASDVELQTLSDTAIAPVEIDGRARGRIRGTVQTERPLDPSVRRIRQVGADAETRANGTFDRSVRTADEVRFRTETDVEEAADTTFRAGAEVQADSEIQARRAGRSMEAGFEETAAAGTEVRRNGHSLQTGLDNAARSEITSPFEAPPLRARQRTEANASAEARAELPVRTGPPAVKAEGKGGFFSRMTFAPGRTKPALAPAAPSDSPGSN